MPTENTTESTANAGAAGASSYQNGSTLRFPVELRKMWSGNEVQAWIDAAQAVRRSPIIPCATLTVAADGAVSAILNAPGLPPGSHDVYPCPVDGNEVPTENALLDALVTGMGVTVTHIPSAELFATPPSAPAAPPATACAGLTDAQGLSDAMATLERWAFIEKGKQHNVWSFASHDLETAMREILSAHRAAQGEQS